MSTQTTGYLEAAADLQPGGRLALYDVPWEQYEQLLNDLGDDCHLRISFNEKSGTTRAADGAFYS